MKRSLLVAMLCVAGSNTSAAPQADEAATVQRPVEMGASIDVTFMAQHPPSYPADARKANVTGTAVLLVLVAADGSVKQIKVEKTAHSEELDAAAVAAAKTWHYRPALHDGKPMEDWVRVPVTFAP